VRHSRFSVEQIIAVLKQAELGMPIPELIRKVGISEQTFYRWKKQYGGLQPDQARELKQLQEENARLKKLVADLSLDKAILQDVAKKSGATRAEEADRGLRDEPLERQPAPDLPLGRATAQQPSLRQPQGSEARPAPAHAGDRHNSRVRYGATGACTSCCAARAGRSDAVRPTGSTARSSCSCARSCPGAARWSSRGGNVRNRRAPAKSGRCVSFPSEGAV
jgi:putative transposase